jgi:hypothetical protein
MSPPLSSTSSGPRSPARHGGVAACQSSCFEGLPLQEEIPVSDRDPAPAQGSTRPRDIQPECRLQREGGIGGLRRKAQLSPGGRGGAAGVCPVLDARDQAAARRPSEEGGRRLPAFIRDGATPSKGQAPRWVAIYLTIWAVLNRAARSTTNLTRPGTMAYRPLLGFTSGPPDQVRHGPFRVASRHDRTSKWRSRLSMTLSDPPNACPLGRLDLEVGWGRSEAQNDH